MYETVKKYMDKSFQNVDNPVFYNRYLENYLVTLPFISMMWESENLAWANVLPYEDLTNLVLIPTPTWLDVISPGLINNYKL